MKPRIYTYKITFEEVPYYYYGSKKEKYYNQEYWGSPKTHKWVWNFYTPKKQILEIFNYTDEGYEECRRVEDRLIKPVLNDPWCLNSHCGGNFSLEINRKTGKKTQKLGIGIFDQTSEKMSENGKKGTKRQKELGIGLFSLTEDQLSKNGKKGAEKIRELGLGIFSLNHSDEKLRESKAKGGRVSGKDNKILGRGIFSRWMCLETGHISNPGGLSHYQKARGIDTTKRVRLS